MRLLITGASGLLGKKLMKILSNEHQVFGTYSTHEMGGLLKLDLAKKENIKRVIEKVMPQVVIHTATITDVDYCERKKNEAWNVNVDGSFYLVTLCKKKDIRLVYISTDYIFSGKNSPYMEDDTPHPINFYGQTKLEAENLIRKTLLGHVIIRPSILYGYNDADDKPTFPIQVLVALRNNQRVSVDDYRIKYPTWIDDIANGICQLLATDKTGVFHFSNKEPMTRYEWALKIADVFGYSHKNILRESKSKEKHDSLRPYNIELVSTRELGIKFAKVKKGIEMIKSQMGMKQ